MEIKSIAQLREHYGFASGRAKDKQFDFLDKHAINFIEHSPFLIVSTFNIEGRTDSSPKGGLPGFVKVGNKTQLIIPDAKGNNRLDGLMNIIETGQVGLLFLIPGIDETLRVNGTAYISTDDSFISLYNEEKNPPKSCVIVEVEEMFLHCAKAFMRSKLWDVSSQINRAEFPTMGQMLKDQLESDGKTETREEMVKRYQKDL